MESLIVFIFGLCVGSFVNMAVYRYAVKIKIQKSKVKTKIQKSKFSCCDFCGRQLRWYENIPVVSWVIQAGKSRCCGKRLSITYPIVELLMGILFSITYYVLRITYNAEIWQIILGLIIVTLLVFSAVVDAKYMILPDFSTIILVALALFFGGGNILTALGAAGFLGLLYLLTRGKGMGLGDVKLSIFMGLFLGWPKIVVAFYLAFMSGAIVGAVMLILKRKERKSEIAFGPFLILGTISAWYYGSRIWEIVESRALPAGR